MTTPDITFTSDQAEALQAIEEFCASNKIAFLLSGSAGTGKTTLMKYFTERSTLRILGLAPTHKAKKVLKERLPQHDVMTLAKFLHKVPKHTYIGAKAFEAGTDDAVEGFDLFILDEVSMVSDADFKLLKNAVARTRGKILAIGDECQIPAVSQRLEEVEGMLVKKPCAIFKLDARVELTQIVRQALESPILRAAHFLRENLDADVRVSDKFSELALERALLYETFSQHDPLTAKIIAYTNKAVEAHNQQVRRTLGKKAPFTKGEVLMGYQTIGYPNPFIENSGDYMIERVKEENNGLRQGMKGWTLYIKGVGGSGVGSSTLSVFFPTLDAPQNESKLRRLVELARKVNSHRSTKKDYAQYRGLKDKLLFLQNVYEYDSDVLLTEAEFKTAHPLLFTSLTDVVDENNHIVESELVASIRSLYGSVIEDRLRDDKTAGDQETLASQFCIFEKDLDYGYACTAHKAQGSTLRTVFVDEMDFERLKNRYHHRTGLVENKTREKNQLKYVAITRASESLFVLK